MMKKTTLLLLMVALFIRGTIKADQILIPSGATLQTAIDTAVSGDTLYLADGGEYSFNTVAFTAKKITMMAQPGATVRPHVVMKVMQIKGKFSGILFRGIDFQADPNNTGSDYFLDCQSDMDSTLYVKVYDCTIRNFGRSFIRGNRAEYSLDTLIVDNVIFTADESFLDNGQSYATFLFGTSCKVKYLQLTNSTFNKGTYIFLSHMTTSEKHVVIDHCTFHAVNVPYLNEDFIRMDNATTGSFITITNSIITRIEGAAKKLFTIPAEVADTIRCVRFYDIQQDTSNIWNLKESFINANPLYADSANADFTLGNPDFLTASTTGGIIGDPRWEPLNNDATLTDLAIDGNTINGFDPGVYFYIDTLPEGTTEIPLVSATVSDTNASVEIHQSTTFADTAYVLVTAEDGKTHLKYKVKFLVSLPVGLVAYWKMDDGSGINVKDEFGLSNGLIFNSDSAWTDGYIGKAVDMTAKKDTDTSLFIQAPGAEVDFSGSENFSVSIIVKISDLSQGAEQSVFAKGIPYTSNGGWYHFSFKWDNTSSKIAGRFMVWDSTTLSSTTALIPKNYPANDWVHVVCVRDRVADSLYIYLNGIKWDAVKDNVEGDISNDGDFYIGSLPGEKFGTDTRGAVDELQVYEKALTASEIKILSESFGFIPIVDRTDATLSDLKVSDVSVSGFDATVLSYNIELASGTTAVPVVNGTANDVAATVAITNASALPGSTTIKVTAQDGKTQIVYTINFTVAKSSNADLSSITLNPAATLVPEFIATILSYTVELPEGTTSVTVDAVPVDSKASVTGTGSVDVSSGSGSVNLLVTAEDGTIKTYTISFTVITAIIELSDIKLALYPNPVSDIIQIENADKFISIKIFNTEGREIISLNNLNTSVLSIEVKELNNGVYIVHAETNNHQMVKESFIKK